MDHKIKFNHGILGSGEIIHSIFMSFYSSTIPVTGLNHLPVPLKSTEIPGLVAPELPVLQNARIVSSQNMESCMAESSVLNSATSSYTQLIIYKLLVCGTYSYSMLHDYAYGTVH